MLMDDHLKKPAFKPLGLQAGFFNEITCLESSKDFTNINLVKQIHVVHRLDSLELNLGDHHFQLLLW